MGTAGEIVAPAAGKLNGEGLAKGTEIDMESPHAHSGENSKQIAVDAASISTRL
jgi:hypothetical protein